MLIQRLESTRLIVRAFVREDLQTDLKYLTDSKVMHYVEGGALTHDQVNGWIEDNAGPAAKQFVIEAKSEKSGRCIVGHLILHEWFVPETYEIGWVIAPKYQRNGYATEAAEMAKDYVFRELNAHRLIATCQPENVGSWRVMEKLGMRREGHFRACIKQESGIWWDEYFYALLRSEWLG